MAMSSNAYSNALLSGTPGVPLSSNSVDALYYSPNNLDNTYSQVVGDVLRRTNKDISKNSNYRVSFNKMASIVFEKIPQNERNLAKCNTTLMEKSVQFFHTKIFQKNMQPTNSLQPRPQVSSTTSDTGMGFSVMNDNSDLEKRMNDSRTWGYIPAHEIRGRVLFRLRKVNARKLQR